MAGGTHQHVAVPFRFDVRLIGLVVLACAALFAPAVTTGERGQDLDLRISIEAAHFMLDPSESSRQAAAIFSPDGRQFAVRLVRADIARDGAWLEVYLGRTDSKAPALRRIARLFTRGLERPPVYRKLLQDTNTLVWLNSRQFAFLWEDASGTAQIVAMDAADGRLTYLTRRPSDVISFKTGPQGVLTYLAQRSPLPATADDPYGGTLIAASDVHALLSEKPSLGVIADRYWLDAYVMRDSGEAVRLPIDFARSIGFDPVFAPAGDQFVVNVAVARIPETWHGYRRMARALPPAFLLELESRSQRRAPLTQAMIIDAKSGMTRSLWDRPSLDRNAPLSWSPSGREVLIPAALPAPEATGDMKVALFATVDAASGVELRAEDGACGLRHDDAGAAFTWTSDTLVNAQREGKQFRFRRTPSGWRCAAAPPTAAALPRAPEIVLRQSLNRPPILVATRSGKDTVLLDPAPELATVALGRVARFEPPASLEASAGWLYYPLGYQQGHRYPFVLQLTGAARADDHFSLHGLVGGAGLGASDSIYAAQLLSARGIMVLSLPRLYLGLSGRSEAEANRLMIEGVIRELDRRGLIDRARVGLAGFSRPGWLIAYCLTHSPESFAAALISDSTEVGYVMTNVIPEYGETEVGTAPFGKGLEKWLEQAPAFAVERIRTPLRIHNEMLPGGAGRLSKWELFSRMRRLGLPVEYYEIPDIEHGSHSVQNPRQAMASKGSAVDWFDFWLNGKEATELSKADQYARWRELSKQQEEVLKQPRPPLLKWTATPIPDTVQPPELGP